MLVLADKNSPWPNDIFCRLVTAPWPPGWCSQLGLCSSSRAGGTQSPTQLEHPHLPPQQLLASSGVGTGCRAEAKLG